MTNDELRVIVAQALVTQIRTTKRHKRKKLSLLWYRLRAAMHGVGYLELPDGSALQWVMVPHLHCGKCKSDIERRPALEIIAP